MRYLRYLLLVALAVVLVTVALANRYVVTLRLLPLALAVLLGIDQAVQLPLFAVIFGGIVAGVLIGFVWEWFREHGHRATASQKAREVARLERELAVLKDSTSTPPQDEVLALLDKR